MSLSTLLFSAWPALLDSSLAVTNPFVFNANLLFGKVLAVAAFLVCVHPELLRWTCSVDGRQRRPFLVLAWRLCRSRLMFWSVMANSAHLLFALSIRHVDTTIATIFHESSPILHMWLISRLSQPVAQNDDSPNEDVSRYKAIGATTVALWVMALLGMAFVVGGSGSSASGATTSITFVVFGIVLAAASGVAGALNAVHFRWGADLRRDINEWQREQADSSNPIRNAGPLVAERDSVELACIMTCYGIAAAAMAPVSFAAGSVTGGTFLTSHAFLMIGAGCLVFFPGHLFARWSLMKTTDLSINAVGYATPVLALFWLVLFTEIGNIGNTDLVVLGAGAVLAANILLQVQPETQDHDKRRIGFPALIIGLWACGTAVHFRTDMYRVLGIQGFEFTGESYWGLLGLVSATFALILSFRAARVSERGRTQHSETSPAVNPVRRAASLAGNRFDVTGQMPVWSLGIGAALILVAAEPTYLDRPARVAVELGAAVLGAIIMFLAANQSALQIQPASNITTPTSSGGRMRDDGSLSDTIRRRAAEQLITALIAVGLLTALAVLLWQRA